VTRLVRAFEIITEEELARITPKAPAPAPAAPAATAQPAASATK
jgi:hypothetical protein